MVIAYTYDKKPITVDDIKATGVVTLIMKDALLPNLVQTLEHTLPLFMVDLLQILPMDVILSLQLVWLCNWEIM